MTETIDTAIFHLKAAKVALQESRPTTIDGRVIKSVVALEIEDLMDLLTGKKGIQD